MPETRKCSAWQIRKRDGSEVPFDYAKVKGVVLKCLIEGMKRPEADAQRPARKVADAVVRILSASMPKDLCVEHVQDLVIQQLWAVGEFDATKHYTLYRDRRQKVREAGRAVPEAVRALVDEDRKVLLTDAQCLQFYDKYARWRPGDGRRETWSEACDRVIEFFRTRPQLGAVGADTWQYLRGMLFSQRASCAMRVLQMAGPPLERCNTGAYNCWYTAVDDLQTIPESLYLLMQGGGVGFSVEGEHVDQLPRVKKQKGGAVERHVIGDSTEGWCDAVGVGLDAWYGGRDVEFDDSQVRPEGARLKTKGGRSSGPAPLRTLLAFIKKAVLSRQGARLSPREVHDIMCVTGKIVQGGGVRRSSLISISDLDDLEMREAKFGTWYETAVYRSQANNTAAYEQKPSAIEFMREWLNLAASGSGERGILCRYGALRHIPKRRKKAKFGLNPCGEILLRSKQPCNLSIAVARADDTPESLAEKVTAAAVFGTMQATLTDFKYVRDTWRKNAEEERLLGVDIGGTMDCPLLRPGPGRAALLNHLRDVAVSTNEKWASVLGIPRAAAVTTEKPAGNSAWFFGCSSGIHARWSRHQIRRFRVHRNSPVAAMLIDYGVPHCVDPYDSANYAFDLYPDPAPDGCPTRNDMTAVEQFHNWLEWHEEYTEHNPSCTVYVGPDEWVELGHEVYRNFDRIGGGISFSPRDSGVYRAVPNEEITEDQWCAARAAFPQIDWSRLCLYERQDMTDQRGELACSAGGCEL